MAGIKSVAFRAGGGQLATCGRDFSVRVWDVATGRQLWKRGHDGSHGSAQPPDSGVLRDQIYSSYGPKVHRVKVS